MSVTQRISDREMDRQYREELLENNRRAGFEQTLEYIREYGDLFVLEDEDVSQSAAHIATIHYLTPLLLWLFDGQNVGIADDFRFYQPGIESSKVSPDIAVVDGLVLDTSNPLKSYGVGLDGPPPRVVFEVASESTWEKDLELSAKLGKYARMGIKEYFACDPNPEQVWEGEWLARGRLTGWRLTPGTDTYTELKKDRSGRFKSEQLDSWLKMEVVVSGNRRNHWLRLYDLDGNLRLTAAEAEHQRAEVESRRAEVESRRAEVESRRAEVESRRAEVESRRAETENRRAEAENRRAEAEHQRAEVESRRAETESHRAETESHRAEVESRRAETEHQRAEQAELALLEERKRTEIELVAERQRVQELEALLHQLRPPE